MQVPNASASDYERGSRKIRVRIGSTVGFHVGRQVVHGVTGGAGGAAAAQLSAGPMVLSHALAWRQVTVYVHAGFSTTEGSGGLDAGTERSQIKL